MGGAPCASPFVYSNMSFCSRHNFVETELSLTTPVRISFAGAIILTILKLADNQKSSIPLRLKFTRIAAVSHRQDISKSMQTFRIETLNNRDSSG